MSVPFFVSGAYVDVVIDFGYYLVMRPYYVRLIRTALFDVEGHQFLCASSITSAELSTTIRTDNSIGVRGSVEVFTHSC